MRFSGQAKFGYSGSILSLSQFLSCPAKIFKNDSKTIISIHKSESVKHTVVVDNLHNVCLFVCSLEVVKYPEPRPNDAKVSGIFSKVNSSS